MKNIRKLMTVCMALLISAMVMYACSDSFLEIPPQNALSESNLTTVEGIDAALLSAYSMLDGWNGSGNPWGGAQSNYLWGDIMSDDAYKGSEPTDFPDWEVLEKLTWTSTHPELNNKFIADYEGIARANAAIRLAKNGDLTDADRNRILGEARFLRAHFHFDLYKMFQFVPYYYEDDIDFKKPNTDESGNYINPVDDIIQDFETAAEELPASQSEVGRVNSYSALAYLGKVLVYNEQFDAAKTALDQVVDSGPFSLQDCYHDVFSVPGENGDDSGRESILSFQASVNDGTGNGENANHLERLTFAHGGSPFGCCGVRQPSQNLVNAYKVDANGLPLFDTYNDSDLTSADPVDPRLDWVVARPGVPVLNYYQEAEDGTNSLAYSTGWVRAPNYGGPYSNKKIMYHYGQGEQSSVGWSNTHLSSLNVHLLRFSEVLLLLAEAEASKSSPDLNRAMELVNMVRTRAGNCAQGPSNSLDVMRVTPDDASTTWADYNVGTYTSFPDQGYALRAIQWERRLELAMEGHRFFDLRRWGIAADVMNEYFAEEQAKRAYLNGYTDYDPSVHRYYPLPAFQIDLSKVGGEPQLRQVPGWE